MRLITDVLRDIRKGRPVEEATMALADIVRAVDETGKEGSVTITLKVKPAKHGGPEKTLVCEVKAKKPIAEIAPAVFGLNGRCRDALSSEVGNAFGFCRHDSILV
jgi:hypothetical protein